MCLSMGSFGDLQGSLPNWSGGTAVSCWENVSYVLKELQHVFTLIPLKYLPSDSHGAVILASSVLTGSLNRHLLFSYATLQLFRVS